MIYITIAGENATQLASSMASVLSRLSSVVTADGCKLLTGAQEPELLLWHGNGDMVVRAPRSILVFGETLHHAASIDVPADCVVIASTEDEAAAGYAARRGLRLLDCGLSGKASLTFSSIGRENGVVSLQRCITDLRGESIEPLELPLGFEPKPYYPLLASMGVLLLAGLSTRFEQNKSKKNWM